VPIKYGINIYLQVTCKFIISYLSSAN